MATKAKESSTSSLGKEKRATSSSNSHTAITTRSSSSSSSSRPSSTPPPSNPKPSSSTTTNSTEKPIPNYLKPTISSRHEEALKPLKKQSHDHNHNDSNQKHAVLNRRRSFDKPPSASRVQSALISPGPKERKITVRSSSFSSKTTPSSKAASSLDRPLKSHKPSAKAHQPLHSKASHAKSTTAASTPKKDRIPKSPDYQTQTAQENVNAAKQEATAESLDVNDHGLQVNDEVAEVENSDQVPQEEPKVLEDNSNGSSDDAHVNNSEVHGQDEKECDQDPTTRVSEEEVKAEHIPEAGLEETIEEKPADDISQLKEENIDHDNNAIGVPSSDTAPAEDQARASTEAKEDHVAEEEDEENEAVEDKTVVDENRSERMKTMDVEEEDQVVCEGGNDKQEGHNHVEEAKPAEEAEASTVKRPAVQGGQAAGGKKDAPGAYNDVIEETASKLLEKRKNKVRALVGAFETVIDYESK